MEQLFKQLNPRQTRLAPFVIEPTQRQTATVFWLHGLGDSGAGWSAIFEKWVAQKFSYCKFIFPNATIHHIDLFAVDESAWQSIKSPESVEDQPDKILAESVQYIRYLIDCEMKKGIAASRILVGGFSQGAALSLFTVYTSSIPFAGCIALSGYLPAQPVFEKEFKKESSASPLLQCHGEADPIVAFPMGLRAHTLLKEKYQVKDTAFLTFPRMKHECPLPVLTEAMKFMQRVLPPSSPAAPAPAPPPPPAPMPAAAAAASSSVNSSSDPPAPAAAAARAALSSSSSSSV